MKNEVKGDISKRKKKLSETEFINNFETDSCDTMGLHGYNKLKAIVSGYGARVVSISSPDAVGNIDNLTLGYSTLDGYVNGHVDMGALVGRYANRIADGRFNLDGQNYQLTQNEGASHLHGGLGGTMRQRFKYNDTYDDRKADYTTTMPDGEDGYPGNLKVQVWFELLDDHRMWIIRTIETDKPTPINLVNHSYFNLSDEPTILDHYLNINADAYLPVDERLIPTGEIRSVEGTPFDFREPVRIGDRIDIGDEQLRVANGFDHNFVLDKSSCYTDCYNQSLAATLYSPATGRFLEVWTTEPGLHFYSGNHLGQNSVPGRRPLIPRAGLCLNPQLFPDSPNQPGFPDAILRPFEEYISHTTLSFFAARPGSKPWIGLDSR
jgi:aldose 1-epimerase